MHLPRRDVHHVPNLQLLRLFSLGVNQARADSDSEDLAALVPVPEGACAWCEAHVVGHAVTRLEDRVHMYGASEGLSRGARGGVGLVGAADELHRSEVLV